MFRTEIEKIMKIHGMNKHTVFMAIDGTYSINEELSEVNVCYALTCELQKVCKIAEELQHVSNKYKYKTYIVEEQKGLLNIRRITFYKI